MPCGRSLPRELAGLELAESYPIGGGLCVAAPIGVRRGRALSLSGDLRMSAINFSQWPCMSRLLDELLDADAARRTEQLAQIGAHDPQLALQLARLLARQVEVDTTHFLEGTALTAADRVSLVELLAQAAARWRATRRPL